MLCYQPSPAMSTGGLLKFGNSGKASSTLNPLLHPDPNERRLETIISENAGRCPLPLSSILFQTEVESEARAPAATTGLGKTWAPNPDPHPTAQIPLGP